MGNSNILKDKNLIGRYGYAIIPKGSFLFRRGEISAGQNALFFALHAQWAFTPRDNSTELQVWRTLKDIQVLFMVKGLNDRAFVESAIVEIYELFFDNSECYNDLDIKFENLPIRDKLIEEFRRNNIIGWLSSIEDNDILEICLFPNEELNELIVLYSQGDQLEEEYEHYNTLEHIVLSLPQDFVERSRKAITWPKEFIREARITSDTFSLYNKLGFDEE